MTIAIRVELKEDWGGNCPCVYVMARTFGRKSSQHEIAKLTPTNPVADVCITKEQDLYFEAAPYSMDVMEGCESHRGYITPTPGSASGVLQHQPKEKT